MRTEDSNINVQDTAVCPHHHTSPFIRTRLKYSPSYLLTFPKLCQKLEIFSCLPGISGRWVGWRNICSSNVLTIRAAGAEDEPACSSILDHLRAWSPLISAPHQAIIMRDFWVQSYKWMPPHGLMIAAISAGCVDMKYCQDTAITKITI